MASRPLLAIAVLIVLVIAHYKLLQLIQLHYDCKFLLLFFTAVLGTIPLFFVRTLAMHGERERRRSSTTLLGINSVSSENEMSPWAAYYCPFPFNPFDIPKLVEVRPLYLLLQGTFVGCLNTLAFFTSLLAITSTTLWIAMGLFKVDCVFNLGLSVMFLGEKCSIHKAAGSILALLGAALIFASSAITRGASSEGNTIFGDAVSVIYALELSVLMIAWKKFLNEFSWAKVFALNGIGSCVQIVLVAPVLIWAYTTGAEGKGENKGTIVALCILNGVVSLLLALWWSFCIGYTSPTYVAVAGVAVVPVTTLLDFLTYNIRLHWLDGLATALIVSGFLMTRHGYNAENEETRENSNLNNLAESDSGDVHHRILQSTEDAECVEVKFDNKAEPMHNVAVGLDD
mmetsp:Transcript_1580/g.2253  ORF Transcript_1580/g.2253 Transcript_1580/m.2253 type:complete len:400 (+) Transcript_1580:473-1672(+)